MSQFTRRQFMQMLAIGGTSLAVSSTLPTFAQDEQPQPLRSLLCPILMYHYISSAPEDAGATLRDLTVPPEQFATHLDFIRESGFTTITMRQLWQGMMGEIVLPEKPIVLTFDDGYWDAFAHATPLMLERGMTGTVFVVSSFMDQPGYLTWGQAQQMHNSGIEIGCHSATHPDLSRADQATQVEEIVSSTQAIESVLGSRPVSFCYPFGRQNRITRLTLQDQGYHTAVTTSDGTIHYANNPYRMRRVRIRNRTTLSSLEWLINRRA